MRLSRESLENIAIDQGSSFYILDPMRFRENYFALLNTFRSFYPNTSIAYSYKTNYVPRFCQIVKELGGYAEVVSGMEISLAQRIGMQTEKIFYNGPYKEEEYIEKLLIEGGIVNVDSIDELKKIDLIAKKWPKNKLRIGLRCNFDVCDNIISRFGIDVFSCDFINAVSTISKNSNLQLVGLHCHFATRSQLSWENRTKGMLKIIDEYFSDHLDMLEYVSLGGGLYGCMPEKLKTQFDFKIPSFEDYAYASARPFYEYFKQHSDVIRPLLIIEPGTALVADSVKYVTKVVSIKSIKEKTIVTLSGSIFNINPNSHRKNVPIEIYPSNSTSRLVVHDALFAGYTCVESDYLYKDYSGEIGLGDFIVFNDAGSYSIVMKPPFIMPNVAVIEIDDCIKNGYSVIKRKETFEDVFQTYKLV